MQDKRSSCKATTQNKKVSKQVLTLRRRKVSILYHLISVVFADNFCTQATHPLTNGILLLSWNHQHSMHRQLSYNSNVMLQYSNLNASWFGGSTASQQWSFRANQKLDMVKHALLSPRRWAMRPSLQAMSQVDMETQYKTLLG